MKEGKLKTPTDLFRSKMIEKSKQYKGSRRYALLQAYEDLLQEDLDRDTFKDISLLQMNDVYETLLRKFEEKETFFIPKLELVTKYGKGVQKIHHYQCDRGIQYLVCNIGILYFDHKNWKKFKENLSIWEIESITKKTFRYTKRKLLLNDLQRHLFFQLYHNHNANYEYDGGTKINWKELKGIKFRRAQIGELPHQRPKDMMS